MTHNKRLGSLYSILNSLPIPSVEEWEKNREKKKENLHLELGQLKLEF